LSAELEKATANQYTVLLASDGKKQTKAQTLKEAGIAVRTDHVPHLDGERSGKAVADHSGRMAKPGCAPASSNRSRSANASSLESNWRGG